MPCCLFRSLKIFLRIAVLINKIFRCEADVVEVVPGLIRVHWVGFSKKRHINWIPTSSVLENTGPKPKVLIHIEQFTRYLL